MRKTFRAEIGTKITLECNTGSQAPEIDADKVSSLEREMREFIRIRRAIESLQAKEEAIKQSLANAFGDDVPYIHYNGRERSWKVRLYVNYSISPNLVQEKLGISHPELLKEFLHQGTPGRFVVKTNRKSLKDTQHNISAIIASLGGTVRHYASLEPFLDEAGLVAACKTRKINLSGTKTRQVTAYLNEEA